MLVSDEVMREALDIVLTWGPERATPEIDRLLAKFPDLFIGDVRNVLARCHQVISDATDLAPAVKANTLSMAQAETKLCEERPWMTDDQASRAMNQGMYYDWHG